MINKNFIKVVTVLCTILLLFSPTALAADDDFALSTNPLETAGAAITYGEFEIVPIDYDCDNDIDFLGFDGSSYYFYRNNGSGVFTEITPNVTFPVVDASEFLVVDVNNDNADDILVADSTASVDVLYYINNGSGSFTQTTDPVSTAGASMGKGADDSALRMFVDIDYDNDGDSDFIAYNGDPIGSGAAFLFYRNNGSGVFTEVTPNVPLQLSGITQFLVVDVNNDYADDILIVNDSGTAYVSYYENNGSGTFSVSNDPVTDAGASMGYTGSGAGRMFTDIDFDMDGDRDFIAYNGDPVGSGAAYLFYENNGFGSFTEVTPNTVFKIANNGLGLMAVDVDNDGDEDLFDIPYDETNMYYYRQDAATASPLTGTAGITGTAKYGQELTATLTGSNNSGTPLYQWARGSSDIFSATSEKYTLASADIGQQISVKITSNVETGTITSAQTLAVEKADCATTTGVTPVLDSKTDTQITLTAVSGYEYVIVSNGSATSTGTWQDSNIFTGLTASTAYDAYQRVKETATHKASAESAKLDVATNNPALTGTAGIIGTLTYGQELEATYSLGNNSGTLSYQWVRGSSDISSATSLKYTLVEADIGQQISVKITSNVETGTITSAQTLAVEKADCATTTGVTPVLDSKTDTQITLTAVSGYEYVIVSNGASTSTGAWQDSNIFTGLTSSTPYDIYQRVKETATHKASTESAKLDIETDDAILIGTANISGTLVVGQTIAASLVGGNNTGTLSYQWVRGNSDIPSATLSTYALGLDDIGEKISVKITSSVETGTITSAQTASVEKQDCSISVGITPEISSKTSTTVTLVSKVSYEYMVVANGAAVSTGTWQNSNVFTGLSGSTEYDFYQRVKETLAQKPSTESPKLDVTTSTSLALTGTASISGTTTYGYTLTANLGSTNNSGSLSYQWVRGNTDITAATSQTYTLAESDVGQQIKVKITSNEETGTITSSATSSVSKASSVPAKGVSPILSSKTKYAVTLTYYAGYEYMVVKNGASYTTGTWKSSNYFSGLSSGTSYDFYQRKKETSTHYASYVSSKLDVTTYSSSSTSSTATPKPTATPTVTVTLMPTVAVTPTVAPTLTPTPIITEIKTTVTPQTVQDGTIEGTLLIEIKVSNLPIGTKSIKISDNSIIEITSKDSVFVTVNEDDLKNGVLEIVTLNEEGVALGSVSIDLTEQNKINESNKMPIWLKIIIGLLITVLVFTGLYVIGLKRRGY